MDRIDIIDEEEKEYKKEIKQRLKDEEIKEKVVPIKPKKKIKINKLETHLFKNRIFYVAQCDDGRIHEFNGSIWKTIPEITDEG
jgi:predicted patatin/cPLA2 family phospholipase|tara:strand:+ start:48 stop:299 length:252 start_codon:yes stop_codon:yes gene_type:complete